MNFESCDDALSAIGYDGFIDRLGNFYKIGLKSKKGFKDTHNEWAQEFMKEKLDIKNFKFNPTASALLTLTKLNGPAEILVNCFGYVYYSHDLIYHSPIIKLPNPKIANYKATSEQLNMLFSVMVFHKEDTNIPIFYDEGVYTYPNDDEYKYTKKR